MAFIWYPSLTVCAVTWHKTAMTSLHFRRISLDEIVKDKSVFSLLVHVKKTWEIYESEKYDVDLKGLDDNLTIADDPTGLEKVLDMVFSTNQKAELNTASPAPQLDLAHVPLEPLEVREPP